MVHGGLGEGGSRLNVKTIRVRKLVKRFGLKTVLRGLDFQVDDGVINGYKLSIFGKTIITLSWNFKLGNYESE